MLKIKPEEFLLNIWEPQGKEGSFFFLSTKSVGTGTWKDHALEWPIKKFRLKKFLKEYPTSRYDLYFCPHPFSKPIRKKDHVLSTNLAWADLDAAKPDSADPKPQIVWESSPGRFAALWRLTYFMDPDEAQDLSHDIADHWGADSCWNLTRVLRIPGTKNHKYEKSPRGKLLRYNDRKYGIEKFNALQVDELDAVEVLKRHKKEIPYTTHRLLTADHAPEGKRSEILWKLNNELFQAKLSPSEIFTLLKASVWNKFRGRKDEDEQLKREIEKANDMKKQASLAGLGVDDSSLPELICPVGIAAQVVDYLWFPYIPKGKLTIIEGDPGLGKSFLTMKLVQHVANGAKYPGNQKCAKGIACIFNAEDGLRDTIIPRLHQFETNLANVRIKSNQDNFNLDVEGFIELEYHLKTYKPKLVIIDPLVAYLDAELDMNKANHMRSVTRQLATLAEEYNVAIIALRHLTKSGKEKAIYRGQGSIDITGAARSVLHMGQDPDDKEGRILCHIKNNIGEKGQSIKMVIVAGSEKPFRWVGHCDYTVADLVSQDSMGSGTSDLERAKTFLEEYLEARSGEALKKELFRDGEAKGISKTTMNRAKREMNILSVRTEEGFVWKSPE